MSNHTDELDKILGQAFYIEDGKYIGSYQEDTPIGFDIKQALLDWHNKRVEEVIKKPHILPQGAQHLESLKQGINFYHRQMRKRVDKLKEK